MVGTAAVSAISIVVSRAEIFAVIELYFEIRTDPP